MNQITINFTPCSPAEGYRVFYREVGDVSFIEHPDTFTSSPIIFQVEGPFEQPYDGYIQSDCGGGLFGPQVPWATVLCPPPEGCCDPVIIDADAETITPDGSESGSESVEGEFLRLVFNTNMSGESLADWNAFFGFTFDNVVYSVSGTVVDLYLSSNLTIPGNLFLNNTTILRVIDFSGLLTTIEGHAFRDATNLIEVDCPACLTIDGAAFFNCSSLTDVILPLVTVVTSQLFANTDNLTNLIIGVVTIVDTDGFFASGLPNLNFPNCTTVGIGGFRFMTNIGSISLPSCTSVGDFAFENMDNIAIISLPVCTTVGEGAFRNLGPSLTVLSLPQCTDLGGTVGNDNVFENIVGNNIVFTLESTTAGDADVGILQANNSVTLILV